ncbi:elongator complex protein 2-like isoform X2 [Babylonia areolata]|uniref:elongator complex protein 2-like isoform X2 n=1 Tax=Babylonia areolata TaxID=304850 RepID=UPI003FD082DC
MAATHMCYTSSGCNRVPHCADWGQNGLICYGSCTGVVIYRPDGISGKAAGALCMLTAHTDRVNCARWIPSNANSGSNEEKELISCSVDKTAILWHYDCHSQQSRQTAILKGHTSSVTVASGLSLSRDSEPTEQTPETVFVTASSDSTVKVWKRNYGCSDVTEVQTLTFGTGFALDLSLILIPGSQVPMLACGADDHKVHLFVMQQEQFVQVMTLLGHEDWVRGVHLTADDSGDVLLASCGQDSLIRLWRLSKRSTDTGAAVIAISDLPPEEDIKMKEKTFSYLSAEGEKQYFAVMLESVLSGHEGWVYSVRWQPPLRNDKGKGRQPLCLLSASMDKTMIIWSPDDSDGVWVEQVRVGEVGGNTLGLFGGLFSPQGDSILAHGYHGALHQWIHNKDTGMWEPAVTGGGHFGSVVDVDWDRGGGNFVLSASVDQTTRLHAPWVKDGEYVGWYEIARPQVHGYDMQCLTMIDRFTFASAGDEKVTRAFRAPRNFIENLSTICGLDLKTVINEEEVNSLPEGASVPSLGLSNKAVYDSSQRSMDDDRLIPSPGNDQLNAYFSPLNLRAPPSEENLVQNTLWPEVHKLYGHGYEVFALACNPAGTLLASSCTAKKAEHASVMLWDTKTWQRVASLEGSSLTVVQMAFSPSGRFLLAVSRDRTWSLYSCQGGKYSRVSFVDKKTSIHSRIIWACAWSPDEEFFFTASRDKKVFAWNLNDVLHSQPPKPVSSVEMEDSVTAIDVASSLLDSGRYLLAMGLDRGDVTVHTWSKHQPAGDSQSWTNVALDASHCHQQTVKRVKFRPVPGLAGHQQTDKEAAQWQQLVSCAADHCVKVHNIHLGSAV